MSVTRHHQALDDAAFKVLNGFTVAFDNDRARGYDRAINGREAGPTAKHDESQKRNEEPPSRGCPPIARWAAVVAPWISARRH